MRTKLLLLHSLILSFTHSLIAQTYPIGQITTTLTDASRSNRQIAVEIFYPAATAGNNTPAASGQFPVIAYGHGFSMTFDAYSNFWNEFVPQGYILIFPKTETGPIPFPSHGEFAIDLSFALSYLQLQNANAASPFFGKISSKSAMMGHSMGGGCTFLAGGSNPNVTTVVGFAPAETNPSAVAAAPGITVPALVFVGSQDNVAPAATHSTLMYNAAGSSCKAYVTITDGAHCRFAESNFLCEFGESSVCIGCSFIDRVTHHAITFQLLNPWLRFYLKGECAQWEVFQDLLTTASGITSQQSCNYSLPVADFTASGSTSFCDGGSVSFTASGNYGFEWSTAETTQTITVTQSGDYFMVATDSYDCKDTSSSTTVDVYDHPSPALSSNGDFTLCEGETQVLFLDDEFASYQWSDGSGDSVLSVNETGDYFVEVVDVSGCAGVSDTVHVEVSPLPETPVIELRNDTLFVISGSGNFQWYRNGTLLNGANGNYLVPDADGDYHSEMTDANDCSASSNSIAVNVTALNEITNDIQIYPNPANGKIHVKGTFPAVELFDRYGRKLISCKNNRQEIIEVELSQFPSGTYFLKEKKTGSPFCYKIIKVQ